MDKETEASKKSQNADSNKADKKADNKRADGDTKAGDTKADDTKADDTKADDTKADDTKADNTSSDQTRAQNEGSAGPSRTEPPRGEAPLPFDRAQPRSSERPRQPAPSTQPPAARPSPDTPSASDAGCAPRAAGGDNPGPQADANAPAPDVDQDEAFPVRTAAGVGALVAAGVIALIGARRAHQQRRRPHRARLPMPEPATAHAEQQLRAAADPLSVDIVDAALRGLARSCATSGQPLPALRAARLTADQLDLYLSADAELPEPWTGTADATVWTLSAEHAAAFTAKTDDSIPAPYPALVTIGHDSEDGHVLLDLEHIGSLELQGNSAATREVLAALAIELATSRWADDLQVTLVGAHPDLEEALQTGRIRYVPTIGPILDELARRAAADRAALADANSPDLQHARVTGAAPDAWTPDILLIAGPLTDLQRNQLARLLDTVPRLAIAAVTTDTVLGGWSLDKVRDGRGTAVLEPIGLAIQPQRVDSKTYAHILDTAAIATEPVYNDSAAPADDTTETRAQPLRLPDRNTSAGVESYRFEAATASEGAVNNAAAESSEPARAETATLASSAIRPDVDDSVAPPQLEKPDYPADDRNDGTGSESVTRADGQHEAASQIVMPLLQRRPTIRVLGPVDLQNAGGTVEPSKRARLLEYAAYLVLHPQATHSSIDDAIWPNRTSQDNLNTRNTATSKLRKWLGDNDEGEPYLPRHSYSYLDEVTSDWSDFRSFVEPNVARVPTREPRGGAGARTRPTLRRRPPAPLRMGRDPASRND